MRTDRQKKAEQEAREARHAERKRRRLAAQQGSETEKDKKLTDTEILDRLDEIYVGQSPAELFKIIHLGISVDNVPNSVRKMIGYGLWFADNPKTMERVINHDPADGVCDLTDIEEENGKERP